jgi:hypothetical protein
MPTRCRVAIPKRKNGRSLELRPTSEGLALLESAFGALARSESFDEIKDIRDKAEALRQYARNAKASLTLQNRVSELKLRAERLAGELLQAMSLHGGDRRSDTSRSRPTLDELGISHNQSNRWQKEAMVPEPEFCAFVAVAQKEGHELTSASLLRLAANRFAENSKKQDADPGELSIPATDATPRADRDAGQPQEIIAEIRNHCETLDGILSPLYDGVDPAQFHSCVGRALQRLVREIKSLLGELERSTTATAKV